MAIIVTKPGAKATKLERVLVNEEVELQTFIADNPECLPVDQIHEDLKLLIVAREFPTDVGSIDALGIDQEGDVYVIETKLYKNSDKRRVVAQVLDYGASLWRTYQQSAGFKAKLSELAEATLKRNLLKQLQDFFEIESDDADQLLDAVAENVRRGRFRFVVLMDHIDDHLKDLLSFLNTNSQFAIFGVELEFYRMDESTIAIPRLCGATSQTSSPVTRVRDDAFFKQAEELAQPDVVAALKDLYDFSLAEADTVSWGRGAKGSFNPKFDSISPKSLYSAYSNGRLYINFKWHYRTETGQKAADLLGSKLRAAGFPIPEDYPDRFVGLNPSAWLSRLQEFKKIVREVARDPSRTMSARKASTGR